MRKQSNSLCREITAQIIDSLTGEVGEWIQPWTAHGLPVNAATRKRYKGINVLLLLITALHRGYASNQWVTFNQCKILGGRIKCNAIGTQIVFYQMIDSPIMIVQEDTGELDETIEKRMILRHYTVFNIEQTSLKIETPTREFTPVETAERLLDQLPAVVQHGGGRAFYNRQKDFIQLPEKETFKSAADYYATRLHETIHWTGGYERLNRLTDDHRFGSTVYAKEELTAELGAAFLCAHCGIVGKLQHAEYIASWLKVLENDVRFIFQASNEAQKAFDFVLGYDREPVIKV